MTTRDPAVKPMKRSTPVFRQDMSDAEYYKLYGTGEEAIKARIRQIYINRGYTSIDEDRVDDIYDRRAEELTQGFDALRSDIDKNATKAGIKTDAPATGEAAGVLAGGQTITVKAGDGTTRYYQVYEFPPGSKQFVSYQFNSKAQADAALGAGFTATARTESWFNQNVLAESQAEEIVGLPGSFGGLMDEIMNDAARQAGIRDPGLVGRIASNPEMQHIMAQALEGDWTPEQVLAEQRRTNFWNDVLYPGIKNFYGRTTEPEKAWANYTGNIAPTLTMLGYKKDADGTYNSQVKKMLDLGIDQDVWMENVPVFAQAAQNKGFFEVMKARAQRELGKTITFGDWFGVVKGEAAPDLARVAEGAVVAYQAQQSDFGLGENMLQRLIAERDLGEAEARNLFGEVNQAVLALGDVGLKRGGLTRDDIVSAAASINPASGMSVDEVKLRIAKIAQENDLFDEEKISFYVGFTPGGTPVRPGLQPLSPEGA